MTEAKKTATKTDRFYKSRKDKTLDGVCAGLADYLGIDATLVRILWFISIFINGIGVIAYVVAAIFVPVNPDHAGLEGEKKKPNAALIVGAILIVLGLLFLADAWDFDRYWRFPHHFRLFPLWSMDWGLVWPVILIALGILYIVYILRKDKGESKEDGVKKASEASPRAKKQKTQAGSRLERIREGKIIAGVCGGIARYFEIDATLVRIGFAVVAVLTHVVFGLLVYVIMAAVVPQESAASSEG